MRKTNIISLLINRFSIVGFGLLLAISILISCNDERKDAQIVINEIMASNHGGLLSEDGKLYDWLEIKNTSNEIANLDGYTLTVEKNSADDSSAKKKSWDFPGVQLKPGECVVIFASKKGKKADDEESGDDSKKDKNKKKKNKKKNKTDDIEESPEGELHSSFKLPAKGGKLQLLKDDEVVSEVTFGKLEDDECLRRLDDGTYEKSYEQTPGFDNNREGFEKFNSLIEKQRKSPLRIWELQPRGYKERRAWVEVKNTSDQPVNLQDYCLTTSKKEMSKWRFPEKQLKPGELYVVDCSKEEFKVGGNKAVILTSNDELMDAVCVNPAPFGTSIGRVENQDGFFFFPSPTRGAENNSAHYRFIAPMPSFNPTAGVYTDTDSMLVRIDTHGMTVHYTTDGSIPNADSPVFKDSIMLHKTTTVRAYCEGDSTSMRSPTATSTFIFAERQHTMPVFNITIAPDDLYDHHRGIYVDGPGASKEFPHNGANYWKRWWKKAHIEFFDSIGGGFSYDCELAIFGGFSRALPKKSFKIKFKDTCGPSNITYDLFGEGTPMKVKNFVLRSGSQDVTGVMVRDEFFTSLMKPQSPTLLVQAYRPVVLYINGEYFGLYYIREKIDKHFVARHLDVSNDSVSIMMSGLYCEEGSPRDYRQLISYARSHDLSQQEHYDYVKSQFDLQALIDFKLGQLYSSNTDAGNVRFVRSLDEKSDKKWHVVFYDLDATWATNKPAAFYLRAGETSVVRAVNTLTYELLKNKDFRLMFIEQLSNHMHTTFTTKNATAVFDNIINTIKPEMEQNCKRWANLMSYSRWVKNVDNFREKFKFRNKIMLNDLRKELAITEEENKKYFSDLGF